MENNQRGKLSLTDIQAEQEREQRRTNHNRSDSKGPRGGSNHGNNGGGRPGYGGGFQRRSSSTSGRRGSQNRRGPDRSGLPLERGCICSLKEKFGFIHCADRPTEIFFHYSEVANVHPDHLQLDDEVEFRVGKSRDNPDKLAALEVNQLPTGTIEWEYEETPGKRYQGLVDRPLIRSGGNNGLMRRNSDNDPSNAEGLIRLLVPASEGNTATEEPRNGVDGDNEDDEKAEKMVADGPKIRFTANDYDADAGNGENSAENSKTLQRKNSTSSTGGGGRLYRGDLVEFSLVIEKRTRQKFARNITLLQSERERARLAKEEQMLANATLERGVVVSLKQDFGFIRSNARRDEVYFHYSQVQLPEAPKEGEAEDGDDEHELQLGQEMEFLVVTEEVEDRNNNNNGGNKKQKTSARSVKFLPKGSVEFSRRIATGVTGKVTIVPRADAGGRNAQKERDPQAFGTIRLTKSITTQDPKNKEPDADPVTLKSVMLHVADSPGGLFTCSRGSAMGLWIREGDTLLFDVTYDFVDNAYYATPTRQLVPDGAEVPASTPASVDEKENSTSNETEKDGDAAAAAGEAKSSGNSTKKKGRQDKQKSNSSGTAVRLIALSLAGRAEGTIHTMKEAYGFIHFSERPVDVHFKQFELLPETLQEDLRRNMGLTMTLTTKAEMMGFHKLSVGTEVQFDLSVQGTVMTQNQHPNRGGNKRGGAQANQHERENLKAQRILILPKGTILQDKPIGLGVKGVITKEDPNQPYAGILDLEQEFDQLTWNERHPLVCKMIEEFLKDEKSDSLVFHDIQSPKEEEVISEIIEIKAKRLLEMTHTPHAGDPRYEGRLCIRKVAKDEVEAQERNDDPNEATESKETKDEDLQEPEKDEAGQKDKGRSKSPNGGRSKSPKGRANKKKKHLQLKTQPIKTVRYDKSSLANNAKTDVPPGVGDTIICDVHQNRRTGKVHLEGLSVAERKVLGADEVATLEGATGFGVVKEVVLASKFGFISVSDENASKRELLFFHFSSVVDQNHHPQNQNHGKGKKAADAVIHKGDEVKFKIGTEKNGKRVAMDIEVVTSGTIPNKVDKNACRGYILIEPTDTQVGSAPKPSRSFNRSRDAPAAKSKGRWENNEDYQKDTLREKGEGVILLIEDPTNMFASALQQPDGVSKEDGKDGSDDSKKTNNGGGGGRSHLHYRLGAIALHGAGAPATMDSSTNPRRGDLVSFVKSKNNATGVKDIRVVDRAVAKLVRGHLENIDISNHTATFIGNIDNEQKKFDISLNEVVSCEPSQLKNKVEVEGLLHDDTVHGFCRVNDLRVKSKLGTGKKERPKLNLTVKKDRAGTIMAQSMMAKGPDGTTGFPPGWTTRVSQYANASDPHP